MGETIINNRSAGRFEIASGESLAVLEYQISGRLMTLVHTEVPEALGGQGLGGRLVKFALEYAERNNLSVVAQCEFARNYLARHREYAPLLGNE